MKIILIQPHFKKIYLIQQRMNAIQFNSSLNDLKDLFNYFNWKHGNYNSISNIYPFNRMYSFKTMSKLNLNYSNMHHLFQESMLIENNFNTKNIKNYSKNHLENNISSHEKGYLYEKLVAQVLSFLLIEQTGKSHDMGVDFLAQSNYFEGLIFLGQCKNEVKKCSGRVIREMQGVVSRYKNEYRKPIGIIVSSNGYSMQAFLHHKQAQEALILVTIDNNGNLLQWDMNICASKLLKDLVIMRNNEKRGSTVISSSEVSTISLFIKNGEGKIISIFDST